VTTAGPATRSGRAPDLLQRWSGALAPTYGRPPLVLESGRGCWVRDVDGAEYLDLVAGIAVNCLGHAHPALVEALTRQTGLLVHTSNLAATRPVIELAEQLLGLLGRPGRVFFANSGAEANEAAFKAARRTGRVGMVAAEGGFHGRTMGALALTGSPAKADPFRPLPGEVTFVPFGDAAALAAAVGSDTAAVVLEVVQGEAGVRPVPDGYLPAAAAAAAAAGSLLVVDEVQTGVGRTGAWFAHTATGVAPDVVTLAKALGGGVPIGATVLLGEAADLLTPGGHGSTFGGNPLAAAAALAVLATIETEGLLARATAIGDGLTAGVVALSHPLVAQVRGRGALLGVVLTGPHAGAVEAAARDGGLLVNAVRPDVVRLAPPLVLSDAEVAVGVDRLAAALDVVAAALGPDGAGGGGAP